MDKKTEITFTIPKCDFEVDNDKKWAGWVIKGSYQYGKKQMVEKLKQIVKQDRDYWMRYVMDGTGGDNPEDVCRYNALESFLDSLKD